MDLLNQLPPDIQTKIYLYMFDLVMNEFKNKYCTIFDEYYDYESQRFVYYQRFYSYDTMYYGKYTDFKNIISIYYHDDEIYGNNY